MTVNLTTSAASVATVPTSVTVDAGSLTAPIPVSAVAPGTAQITASLNGSSQSATVAVTPPLPTVVSLTPATVTIAQDATGTLTLTLSGAPATDTVVTLTTNAAGVANVPGSVTVVAGSLTAAVPVSGMAPGTTQITASLNGSSQSTTVNVTAAIIISGQTPKDATLPGGSRPEIGAAYAVTGGTIDTSQVSLRVNGQDITSQAAITSSGALFLPQQDLPNGTHTVTLTVRDLAGNTATDSWSFLVQDPAPNFYAETPRDVFLVDTQPNIRVLLSGFNINLASVRMLVNGADITPQATVSPSAISYTPSTPLAAGQHTVSVNAVDGNGVAGSKTWSFTIQVLPPLPVDATDGVRTPRTFVPTLTLPQ